MLSSPFPLIRTLDDIRPVLETEGFKLYDKTASEGYYVVNYEKGVFDFPTALHRECRGLIFDREGKLIARRFHKFFNMGEYPETSFEALLEKMQTQFCVIESKIDGSMISPVLVDGKIFWMSKKGVTDTSVLVAEYVANLPEFEAFARYWIEGNCTPIFEYVGPHNRVVIDYPEDLYLLTIRNNETGEYIDPRDCVYSNEYENNPWDFCMPLDYDAPLETIITDLKDDQEVEGVVICFNDGHKVKLKTTWYVTLHKAKDALSHEWKMLLCLHEGLMDDVMPLLSPEEQERIRGFYEKFKEDKKEAFRLLIKKYIEHYFFIENPKERKKQFAMSVIADKEIVGLQQKFLFKVFDGAETWESASFIFDEFVDKLIKQASSASYEKLKELLNVL